MQTPHCLELVYSKIYFSLWKNICFEANQNGRTLDGALKALTVISHQTFSGWEVQAMLNIQNNEWCWRRTITFTHGQNMGSSLQAWVEKTIHEVETHWLSCKEKVEDAEFGIEGHADCFWGEERTHHYWFPWKRCNRKQRFLLLTLKGKFTLFI